MKEIIKLIDYLNGLTNSLVEMDDEGISYFPENVMLPQDELLTLASLTENACKEASSNTEQKVWEIYQTLTCEASMNPKDRLEYAKKNVKFFEENY